MRLRARVRTITGNTRHHMNGAEIPPPAFVEIEPEDDAFYLLYYGETGEALADTWHETLEKAKSQAKHEFEIEDADWEDVSMRLV